MVLGISNAVVAVSADGILVSDKAKSPKVKELIGGLNNRPMYKNVDGDGIEYLIIQNLMMIKKC